MHLKVRTQEVHCFIPEKCKDQNQKWAPEPLYVFRGVVCIRYICYILIVTQWYVIYLADTACAY